MDALKSNHYFEGRKTRKAMDRLAKKEARQLLDGSLGEGTEDLADARAMMETYHWMKSKHIDSVIIHKPKLRPWNVVLVFKDLPRGIPNALGAPVTPKTEEEARFEAHRLLRAAYVKCEDTKQMMRDGTMDDLRMFRLQGLFLQVPGEMVDAVAKKIPGIPEEKQAQKLRKDQIDRISKIIGPLEFNQERWEALNEDQQIDVMTAAATLLCLNINQVH